MVNRITRYYVSGNKTRSVLKHCWWTNRVTNEGWSNFSTVADQQAALRLFKKLRVKHRQIDKRCARGPTKPHAWLWARMTLTGLGKEK
jgi:hypothetical protein